MAEPSQPASAASPVPAASLAPASPEVLADERIFAVIGYLAFLFVIPLVVKPKSKFCQHHAKQSMVMFLLFILVLVLLAAIPWLGSIFTLAMFALYILAIFRAYRGEFWNIPVISSLAGKIDVSTLYEKGGISMENIKAFKEQAQKLGSKVTESVQKLGTPPPQAPPAPPSAPPTTPQPPSPTK